MSRTTVLGMRAKPEQAAWITDKAKSLDVTVTELMRLMLAYAAMHMSEQDYQETKWTTLNRGMTPSSSPATRSTKTS